MKLHIISAISLLCTLMFSSFVLAANQADTATSQTQVRHNTVASWKIDGTPLDLAYSLDKNYVFILTDEHVVLVYDGNGTLLGTVPVADGVTSIGAAPYGEFIYLMDKDAKTISVSSIEFKQDIPVGNSQVKGPKDAPVTITLFTDYECPYCKQVEPTLEKVLAQNSATTRLVFKNMPLQFHKFAEKAAKAALSAGIQGKFWEFHDALFASNKLSDEAIDNIAKDLKLNIEKWKRDMELPVISSQISNDLQEARQFKVTGTPTIFINGWRLHDRSLKGFQEIIDSELNLK